MLCSVAGGGGGGGVYWVKGLVSRYELESGLSWIRRKEDHVREALTKGIWSRRAAGQLSPMLLNHSPNWTVSAQSLDSLEWNQ